MTDISTIPAKPQPLARPAILSHRFMYGGEQQERVLRALDDVVDSINALNRSPEAPNLGDLARDCRKALQAAVVAIDYDPDNPHGDDVAEAAACLTCRQSAMRRLLRARGVDFNDAADAAARAFPPADFAPTYSGRGAWNETTVCGNCGTSVWAAKVGCEACI